LLTKVVIYSFYVETKGIFDRYTGAKCHLRQTSLTQMQVRKTLTSRWSARVQF